MPYNGSGTFNRLYSWITDAANSINISSTRTDAEMNGMAAALSNCITRDGQSPPSADLPMGGKRLMNIAGATAGTDALNRDSADARYIQSATTLPVASGGTGTTSSTGTGSVVLSASPTLTGTVNVTGTINANGGNIALTVNNTAFLWTDASGSHPQVICQSDNNQVFYGTNADGTARTIWSILMRNSSSAFTFSVPVQGPTASVGDNTTKLATTAYVMSAKAPAGQTISSAATATPTFSDDFIEITAQAAGLTLANPTGSAVNMWGTVIRIKDNGTPQTIAYGTNYRGVGVTLPTTTVAGKTLVLGMIYNNALTKWDVVSVAQE